MNSKFHNILSLMILSLLSPLMIPLKIQPTHLPNLLHQLLAQQLQLQDINVDSLIYLASTSLQSQLFMVFYSGSATTTSFNAYVVVNTPCYHFVMRYIGISLSFPSHINVFSNVDIYGTGNLNGISQQVFIMNYQSQSASLGYNFTQFTPRNAGDFSNVKILLFLSCLGYDGFLESVGNIYPPLLNITTLVINITHFKVSYQFGTGAIVSKIHYSIVVYDQDQVINSGLFRIVSINQNFTDTAGGFLGVDKKFWNSTIMGLTDFQSDSTNTFIFYNMNLVILPNGTQGLLMLPPVPQNPLSRPIQRYGITLFYLEAISCPDRSFYYEVSLQLCVKCIIIPSCTECLSNTSCLACDHGYFVNASYLCQPVVCLVNHCNICENSTFCYQCDHANSYFWQINGSCGYCNNSQYMFINTSSASKECVDCSAVNCIFLSIPTREDVITAKRQKCNSFVLIIEQYNFTLLYLINNAKILNQGVKINRIEQINSKIYISAEYEQSMLNQRIKLKLLPSYVLFISYDSFIPAVYYETNQCQNERQITKIVIAYTIISYILLFVSLFSGKIVGLQLFGVLQLSYFTLPSHNFLNLYLAPLTKFGVLNGLNLKLYPQGVSMPSSFSELGIKSNFINNFNIMFLVALIYILVTLALYLLSKFLSLPLIHQYSKHALKQGIMTLVLFNGFNISYSAGTHFRYASISDKYYAFGTFILIVSLLIIIIVLIAFKATNKIAFGEFKYKLKASCESQLFIPLIILYRIFLGFYCAFESGYERSNIVALCISIAFTLYMAINLPFIEARQNYRTCFIHTTSSYILLTTDYYSTMKSTTPLEIKAHIYTPAIIELVLIGLCIFFSAVAIGFDLYDAILAYKQRVKKQVIYDKQNTKENSSSQVNIRSVHTMIQYSINEIR